MNDRRHAALAVLAVMGVLIGLTLWSPPDGRLLALDLAVAVGGWLLSPLLLWRPVSGALGLTVLAALSPAATPPATLGALQVAQRRDFPVAAAIAAAGIAAHAIRGLWRPSDGISFGWWLFLTVVGYGALWGWGAMARARRALLESLRERARRAEAEQGRRVAEARMLERRRIAGEMHDVLAHRLSLLATYAGALEYRPDAPPEQLARAAGVVRAGVHQALDELRDVILILREEEDADERPQPVLTDLRWLVDESRDAGTEVRVRDEVADPSALPDATGRTAYRVIQEALTNARKHAAGLPVDIVITGGPGDRLEVEVSNRLRHGPPLVQGAGTGLVGLTERVRLAGGSLDHAAEAGEFRLHASLPWPS
ncbi:histidine kinase [Spirillospora sp. NPDC029432]|uniref:sensor histidine kinase n=1 Tax=Spirillospora sp. NPDC029432 TaxID=3154599 RepID=UPI0034517674